VTIESDGKLWKVPMVESNAGEQFEKFAADESWKG